jgi:predicted CoA-binding protein
MSESEEILKAAATILLVDWPSRDVPDTLARAGYAVMVKGGPEPDNYSAYELRDGNVTAHRVGRAPEHADLIYSHRPLAELPGIVAMAKELGADAVWSQSGLAGEGTDDPNGCWVSADASREARDTVETAGLRYIDDVYIADAVRRLGAGD